MPDSLRRAIHQIVEDALRFYHLGEYPDTCIMNNPYCECPANRRCQLLPDEDDENDQEEC